MKRIKRLAAEALEALGQLRLPHIDALRALRQPLAVVVKQALEIKESAKAWTVKLAIGLFSYLKDGGEDLTADEIRAAVAGQQGDEAIAATLEGLGFIERGRFA